MRMFQGMQDAAFVDAASAIMAPAVRQLIDTVQPETAPTPMIDASCRASAALQSALNCLVNIYGIESDGLRIGAWAVGQTVAAMCLRVDKPEAMLGEILKIAELTMVKIIADMTPPAGGMN